MAAIRELQRVVRPGGRIAATIWPYPSPPAQQLWTTIFDAAGVDRPTDLPRLAPDKDFPRTHDGLSNLFPVGSIIDGRVRNLTEFGACVEITEEIDGLVHVSDMSWTKRIKHPSEVLKKGDTVRARITNIDVENQRVSLSIKEFMPNEWEDFASQHKVGDQLDGKVVNVTDFGLFIDIYNGLEGLAHISEVDVAPGAKLEDHFKIGDWVRTRVLRIEEEEKKVGLSMRGVTQPTDEEIEELNRIAETARPSAVVASAPEGEDADGETADE
jgi:small subunit ribosomal protein S1